MENHVLANGLAAQFAPRLCIAAGVERQADCNRQEKQKFGGKLPNLLLQMVVEALGLDLRRDNGGRPRESVA